MHGRYGAVVHLRHLLPGADKTEIIWFGSHANLGKLVNRDGSLCFVDDEVLKPVTVVRDVGVSIV
jgi:hypothetical protein